MGIMDVFSGMNPFGGSKQQTPAPAPGAPNPQNLQTQQTPQTDANGVVPNENNPSQQSPLDKHSDLWKTTNTAPQNKPIFEGLDPEKLREAVSKNDFSKVLSQDTLAKIKSGGDDAVAGFAEGMNALGQSLFTQQTLATTQIVEKALEQQRQQFEKMIPNLVRRASSADSLATENPAFRHPAVQPLVEALRTQFLTKNPSASAAEINEQIKDVMTGYAQAFAPAPASDSTQGSGRRAAAKESDWSAFLENPFQS
jgi:hypothetical protein